MKHLHLATMTLLLLSYFPHPHFSLTGDQTISGENIHESHHDHHLDPETGKVIHKRVVRKENFLFVTLKNLDIVISKTEYLVLFVYGEWCEFSKQHHEVFKKFATYHKSIHSKLLFGSLHIAKKEQFTYSEVVSNPTIFLYHHGSLIRRFDFLKENVKILTLRPKILVAFEPFLLSNITHKKHVMHILDQYQRFLIFVSDKNIAKRDLEKAIESKEGTKTNTELPVIGLGDDTKQTDSGKDQSVDRQTKVLGNFMMMSDMRLGENLKYFNLNSLGPLQEFFPEHKILPGHVYLYRKKDHSLMRMEDMELDSMGNWFNMKSWLYHHLHPHILAFPKPAKKRVLDNHNMGLFLFLHGKNVSEKDGVLSSNEQAEAALDMIAKKYYK